MGQHNNVRIPKDITLTHLTLYNSSTQANLWPKFSLQIFTEKPHCLLQLSEGYSNPVVRGANHPPDEWYLTFRFRHLPSDQPWWHKWSGLGELHEKWRNLYNDFKNLSNLIHNILKPHCFQRHFLNLQPLVSLLIFFSWRTFRATRSSAKPPATALALQLPTVSLVLHVGALTVGLPNSVPKAGMAIRRHAMYRIYICYLLAFTWYFLGYSALHTAW